MYCLSSCRAIFFLNSVSHSNALPNLVKRIAAMSIFKVNQKGMQCIPRHILRKMFSYIFLLSLKDFPENGFWKTLGKIGKTFF